MNVRALLALVAVCLLSLAPARAADPKLEQILAKARAAIGSDEALNGIRSLHFEGTIEGVERVPDPADATKTIERPVRLAIDIVFQKPMQQRQVLRAEKFERTTALDEYDGWEKVIDKTKQNPPRLMLMDAAGIKRLRATTSDNLGFFRGFEKQGGKAAYAGEVNVDGKACAKVVFTYSESIVFTRFFDLATGRLVKSELNDGLEIREEGEMFAQGIRFPRKLIQRSPRGPETVVHFDKVTVNEPLPVSEFAMPGMSLR